MIRRPPRSTQSRSSAASDVYKRQVWKSQHGDSGADWRWKTSARRADQSGRDCTTNWRKCGGSMERTGSTKYEVGEAEGAGGSDKTKGAGGVGDHAGGRKNGPGGTQRVAQHGLVWSYSRTVDRMSIRWRGRGL
eukprot:TRINITY_DN2290_c0_g1_i3.p3 TRINITY_DN2290_c0_g1~~TRINITY_DN2290_c0_g1_i3.p3  ORF type:complete len:134 (+),score=21.42 TRINITY_DN2290_c0_g1_i3:65-466(+)